MSALLRPASIPSQAVEKAFRQSTLLASNATRDELVKVLHRAKFERHFSAAQRETYLGRVVGRMVPVLITVSIAACVDPKDDKFLELAVNGHADVILRGDDHLLRMHPFRGVAILTPAADLAL